jgi:hypothetical protein
VVGATLSLVLAVCSADPAGEPSVRSVYKPSRLFAQAIRAQSPDALQSDSTLSAQPDATSADLPPATLPGTIAPNGVPGGVYLTDPFQGGAAVAPAPYCPCEPGLVFGANGPQPYRFGWSTRLDVGFLPESSTSDGLGDFEIFETNLAARYTTGIPEGFPDVIFGWTPEFNLRTWEGPQLVDLPGSVYRFASDFELSTPANNPWSLQLGFTPAFVSDLEASADDDAWNFDGRAVVFVKTAPAVTVAIGAQYLDRVDDQIIPYAGIIWNPNSQWEARLMYPKARVSYLLGSNGQAATWLYGSLEYNIEAYQIGLEGLDGSNEKIQIEDYRAMLGLRTDDGNVAAFIEAGYVFDRRVDFAHGTPGFDISPGFISRIGLRF